jgi:hypothetical protein
MVDGRPLRTGWCIGGEDDEGSVWYVGPDGASSWDPPFKDEDADAVVEEEEEQAMADEEEEASAVTDGPAGAQLKPGWRRCEDSADEWFVNDATGELRWTPPLLAGDEAAVVVLVGRDSNGGANASAVAARRGAGTLAAAPEAHEAKTVTRNLSTLLRKELAKDADLLRTLLLHSSSKGKRRENSAGRRQNTTTAPLELDSAEPDAVRCALRGPEAAAVRNALWDFLGPVPAPEGPGGRPVKASRTRSAATAAAARLVAALDREANPKRLKACAARVILRLVRFQNFYHFDMRRMAQRAQKRERALKEPAGAAAGGASSGTGTVLLAEEGAGTVLTAEEGADGGTDSGVGAGEEAGEGASATAPTGQSAPEAT